VKEGNIQVRFGHDGEASTLILRNLLGAEVKRMEFVNSQVGIKRLIFNLDGIDPGIYIIQVENKYLAKARKIIIH
jgi:hypothetical protein